MVAEEHPIFWTIITCWKTKRVSVSSGEFHEIFNKNRINRRYHGDNASI